jgi:hypothetical protein
MTLKALSPDYQKRRYQLMKARMLLATLLPLSLFFLAAVSMIEVWSVRELISRAMTSERTLLFVFVIFFMVCIYCIGMARISLIVSYHIENTGWARNGVLGTFLVAYFLVFYFLPSPQTVLPLALAKLFSILLYFRFWRGQIFAARFSRRYVVTPAEFLKSSAAFWICRWVLVASFLLCLLGIALALVSVHPVIEMEGWEGFMLFLAFYSLFWVFSGNTQVTK